MPIVHITAVSNITLIGV